MIGHDLVVLRNGPLVVVTIDRTALLIPLSCQVSKPVVDVRESCCSGSDFTGAILALAGYPSIRYDDPAIIAGQGTVALEMLEQAPELDLLVVRARFGHDGE